MNLSVFPWFSKPAAAFLACLFFATMAQAVPSATSVVAVQVVGKGKVSPNYNGRALTNGVKYSMTATPSVGFGFVGWSGSLTNAKSKLVFTNSPGLSFTATFVDKQKPTLSIIAVPNNGVVFVDSLFVGGAAKDNVAVTNVLVRLNGGEWQNASTVNGWKNWFFAVALEPGTNYLTACAVDAAGNTSATNRLKLIYSITPSSLAGYTLTAVDENNETLTFDFGTKTFTDTTDIGNYSYKKLNSITGQLTANAAAPPPTSKAGITLHFTSPTDGTFTYGGVLNNFTLTPNNGWAPPSLTGSSIIFTNDDGIHWAVVGFPEPPSVVGNGRTTLPNPMLVPLDSDYPGQIADRVIVRFAHKHYVSEINTWIDVSPTAFTGSVINIGDSNITVFFDTAPKSTRVDTFTLLDGGALKILSCSYDTYAGDTLLTNSSVTFNFTNSSPDGAMLKLISHGQTNYIMMLFTDDANEGTFYEESFTPTNKLPAVATGTFSIALAPQITTNPTSVATTNGGTASFTIAAKGTPTLLYQWQLNGTNLTDGDTDWGSNLAGTTTTNLVITGVATNDLGSYRALVSNMIGSATSSTATLAFQALPQPPQITNQPPATTTVTNGNTATLVVMATGAAPLAYQWQLFGTNLVDSGNISGTTTSSLFFNPAVTTNTGNYQVIVTNNYGAVTSTPSLLNVVIDPSLPPVP